MLNPFKRLGKQRQQQPAKLLSQADYDTLVRSLATQANQGGSWGQILAAIQAQGLTLEQVAQWMTTYGDQWVQQPEPDFGQGLLRLSQVAEGNLADIAKTLGQAMTQGQAVQQPDPTVLAEIEAYLRGDFSFADLSTIPTAGQRFSPRISVNQPQSTPIAPSTNQLKSIDLSPTDQSHSLTASDWLDQGNKLYDKRRYKEALGSYDQAISLQPDYVVAWDALGRTLGKLGRYEEALASHDRAVNFGPNNAVTFANRGATLKNLGRYKEALTDCTQATIIRPEWAVNWANRSSSLEHLGRYEEALASIDQAVSLEPGWDGGWSGRGSILNKLGRYEEALASADQAVTLQFNDFNTWLIRTSILNNLKRYEEALASIDQALTLRPASAKVWSVRGTTLFNQKRYEEAVASIDQAVTLRPNDAIDWGNRGVSVSRLSSYRPDAGRFKWKIQQELASRSRLALSSFSNRDSQVMLENFLTSLKQSKTLLLKDFANASNPQLLALIQQPPSSKLEEVLSATISAKLQVAVQQPVSAVVLQKIAEVAARQPGRLSPELQIGGYQGQLNSYRAELGEHSQGESKKAICKDTHPEGWGKLHRAIGQAHYAEGRKQASPRPYWQKAVHSFKRALETLQPPKFEHLYFETLQDLIRALLDLEEVQEVQTLQQEATAYIQRSVAEPDRRHTDRQQLGLWLAKFQQLTVDAAIQARDFRQALSTAETAKNVCLRWLFDLDDVPEVAFEQIQALLDDHTAMVYWHLSPATLTTFLLLPGGSEPIVIAPPVLRLGPEESLANDERSLGLKQILRWEDWLSQWNKDYENYSSAQSKTDKTLELADWRRSHPWRTQMDNRLAALGQLLNVEAIHAALKDYPIQQLRLIPHRDLHRFPLHTFFDQYDCTYLPSAKVGLDRLPQTDRPALRNLLVTESPGSTAIVKTQTQKLDDLPFAEVEAELIRQQFREANGEQPGIIITLDDENVPYDRLLSSLGQAHQVFHFTGHGLYNSRSPAQSCLFLTGGDRLTLADIVHPNPELGYKDLSRYQLVFLAACETGVSGNQTITDDYVGLASAFLKAQAGCVVSTLWRIESGSNLIFVSRFYQTLLAGATPARALHEAQDFLKTARYNQIRATFHDYIALIDRSELNPSTKEGLQEILRDELRVMSLRHQVASTIESHQPSNYPYAHPYYWASYTVSGL